MKHFWLAFALVLTASVQAADAGTDREALIHPAYRLGADAAGWRDLEEQFTHQPDIQVPFEERRVFPFHKGAVVLSGEVRVSRAHGLSLHYVAPQERTVVLDDRGVLVREPAGQQAPPPDPRAAVANNALWHVLRFDLSGLMNDFDVYGRREGDRWTLALVPHASEIKRALGNIFVSGEAATVRKIDLWRSARQHIEISMPAPAPRPAFSAEELRQFFR